MAYRRIHVIEIKEILLRIARGQSKRKIRKDMHMHADTINKYIDISRSLGVDPLNSGELLITDELCIKIKQKISNATSETKVSPRDVLLLPLKDKVEGYLKQGLTKTKILCLLERENIKVGRSSFFRFINSYFENYSNSNITVRLPETEPGKYAQADFGRLGKLWDDDTKKLRTAYAFIINLCFSRHTFAYISFSQNTTAVINGCEEAFKYFGGVPLIIIFDNLLPVVDKADRYSPRINKTFLEYAQARGFIVDPANVRCPKGKPMVEKNVSYFKGNFFKGEKFISGTDCQERATAWCTNIAGSRIHGTTKRKPLELFNEIEAPCLKTYDGVRYDIPYWGRCIVHPDHHISFRKALYSVPTKYIGKKLEVKGDSALVRIYLGEDLIKTHPVSRDGRRVTDYFDYPKEITPYTLRDPSYQISQGSKRHPAIGQYIEFILEGPYPWHRLRSAQRVIGLADKYGASRTAMACSKAKDNGVSDIRRLERMLRNNAEGDTAAPDERPPFQESLRFARSGDYFKNYN
jgi:hypothetical protein